MHGIKLFGIDLQMHLNSRHKITISFETRVLDTSNTNIPLTNQTLPIQNFHIFVELVSLGYVMYGNNWCSKHAIYPKGFKYAMYEYH
jgi:histone demethylase JARID1